MRIGDVFRIEVPEIDGEHRIVILYKNEEGITFVVMTSRIQKRIDLLKNKNHPEAYIQKTLVTIEAHEYQSKKNHNACSLTQKTAIDTNNIRHCKQNVVISKTPCDPLPKTLLKRCVTEYRNQNTLTRRKRKSYSGSTKTTVCNLTKTIPKKLPITYPQHKTPSPYFFSASLPTNGIPI